jgi:hypothetical protein
MKVKKIKMFTIPAMVFIIIEIRVFIAGSELIERSGLSILNVRSDFRLF